MRALITGGTGLLGKTLLSVAPPEVQLFATYYLEPTYGQSTVPFFHLDVRDAVTVAWLLDQVRPDVVIHTASIGSVDYAEHHRWEAWAVNVGGTRNIAEACHRHGARLIFISSNAVFDGEHPPYAEEDAVCPINYYGQLKVEGERVVQEAGTEAAIVRPLLMYGWPNPGERDNPATIWLEKLGQGMPIEVVDDVYSKPLFVDQCARACWAVVIQRRSGVYHVAGADRVSLYEFALKVAEVFELEADLIKSVPSSYFPDIAPRPKDTSFITRKMETDLGVRPIGLIEGLRAMRATRS